MILLTVGTQLPFDRFVRIVDDIAPTLSTPVFAQIGHTSYRPKNMEARELIGPIEFDELLTQTTLILSHGGVGTVVMAQRHLKPVILFPRRAELGEHRNDHQLATVKALEGRRGMYVARTGEEIAALLKRDLEPPVAQSANAERDRLLNAVTDFIRGR